MSIDYPRALLAVLALTVGVAVVVAASTSGAAFGLYNPAWDGASDLRALAADAGADPTVVRNASAYGQVPAAGTVALVLAPEARYGPAEAAGIRAFVEGGGTLAVDPRTEDDREHHARPSAELALEFDEPPRTVIGHAGD